MNSKTLYYILKRLLLAIFTIWVIITVTFFVMHAVPGGPFVGEKATTPADTVASEAGPSPSIFLPLGIADTVTENNVLITY